MDPSKLAVVIVNYNGRVVLRDCLASLYRSSIPPQISIVVDNGSEDDSVTMVRRDFPQVTIIENRENLGFAAGNNIGIERALSSGSEAVFVLNNDTIVEETCLERLLTALAGSPSIGAVTPRILFAEPSDRIWSAGGSYDLWHGVAKHYGLRRHADDPRYNHRRVVSFATGCAVLLRSAALRRVGGFDESLFMYNEDADLSWRLQCAGWRILYEPAGVVWHREGWTTRRTIGREWGVRLCVRNILAVHAKHARWYHNITFYPYFVWRWVVLAGMNALVHGRFDVVRGIFGGIAAYRRGEVGKPL